MNDGNYIEDCLILTPKDALRMVKGLNIKKVGVNPPDVKCWIDDPKNPDLISISVNGNEPKEFELEWLDMTFGQVAFFNCACGNRIAKLYLLPHGIEFGCRHCHNLRYRLSNLNPKSAAGYKIHRFDRISKLIYKRIDIPRIFYKGKYTKRFNRFLAQCKAAGLDDMVENAKGMLEITKTQ
ncbi:MAG: hypothetical protein NTW11_01485 [Candidatus Staskawiczbacteria bacterium]|nr:hypothetical protein [Candidatus Staskawiczbacteria bacterium]